MLLIAESSPVGQTEVAQFSGVGKGLLQTVFGLGFPLFLYTVLGMVSTGLLLIRLLLLVCGDVEPNPGPPKRKGE